MVKTTVMLAEVRKNLNSKVEPLTFPLYGVSVQAGFPSPADDYQEGVVNLNQLLVQHPAATFFVRVSGNSMTGAGIHDGDLLVVDRALEPTDGRIVIAVVDGELTVKRLARQDGDLYLMPENDEYPPLKVQESSEFSVWGVVTTVVHSV